MQLYIAARFGDFTAEGQQGGPAPRVEILGVFEDRAKAESLVNNSIPGAGWGPCAQYVDTAMLNEVEPVEGL